MNHTAHLLTAGLESRLPTPPGRAGDGRFATGNRGGPGNPFAREVAALRAMIYRIVTTEDVEKAVRKLIELAREGHFAAIKLFLSYTLGKPTAPIEAFYAEDYLPAAPPLTNGAAHAEAAAGPPSANGARQEEVPSGGGGAPPLPPAPAGVDAAPSPNGERPAHAKPSGGGNQQSKRLLTAALRGKI